MKRKSLVLVMVLALCFTMLVGCGSKSSVEGTTWKMSGAQVNGKKVTSKQLSALGEMSMTFKKDGVVELNAAGQRQESKYKEDGKKITLDSDGEKKEVTIKDNKFSFEVSGVSVEFSKQ